MGSYAWDRFQHYRCNAYPNSCKQSNVESLAGRRIGFEYNGIQSVSKSVRIHNWLKLRNFRSTAYITMTAKPIDISRLETASLVFPSGDVLSNDFVRTKRSKRIHSATYVGNIRHEKVAIVFQTETEVFKVQTTIWLNYGGCIYLKGNITIPVERVLSVDWL
jgi:hypothetical protein